MTCDKVQYPTLAAARRAIAGLRKRRGGKARRPAGEQTAYLCPQCGQYHLTSMTKDQRRKRFKA